MTCQSGKQAHIFIHIVIIITEARAEDKATLKTQRCCRRPTCKKKLIIKADREKLKQLARV